MKRNNKIVSIFFYWSFISLIVGHNLSYSFNAENDSLSNKKRGGLCFRVDDHSNIIDYMNMAEIFNKYNAKFCIALNLNDFKTREQKDSIKVLQEMGHEIMDHTPDHRTNFFTTQFPINNYVLGSTNNPIEGIDHIVGSKICLEFEEVDTTYADHSGKTDILGNLMLGDFSALNNEQFYIYFPALNQLVAIDSLGAESIKFLDVWDESIELENLSEVEYYSFKRQKVPLSDKAFKLLVNETAKLSDDFNLKRPKVWIQPGGNFPQFDADYLKNILGDDLNFVAGSSYKLGGRKMYNEYDPRGNEKFEMQWGDFFEDDWTLEKCKKVIADGIAKHYVLIGHSHLLDLPGSLEQHFGKIDSLLAWAAEKNIPIRTYSEWAEILYDRQSDPNINVFPPLNVDLDGYVSVLDVNGIPDGYVERYWDGQGQWEIDTVDSAIEKYCFSISGATRICRVDELAGIEKGKNDFKIHTKGESGDSIVVIFTYGIDSQTPDEIFRFPADTQEWKEYTLEQSTNGNNELIIPENESSVSIDIKCSNYESGKVKISGMYLAQSKITSANSEIKIIPTSHLLSQNYPNPFNPSTIIKFSIPNISSNVVLKVHDVLGREIRTLVNEGMKPGNYEVKFDGNDLSSGVYFYTFNVDEFHQTKKMMLIK
jgi:Secretion system C-terminal sorting domain